MQPIDINSITLEQAESLAYREILKRDTASHNLQILQQVIQQKSQKPAEAEPQAEAAG